MGSVASFEEHGSEEHGSGLPGTIQHTAKILIVGPFAVGKTTLVGSVSDIAPLRTEEPLTVASTGVDSTDGVTGKRTTTVAMDFGRITLSEELVLFLFGAPGQRRFWPLWDDLARGALGALVIVDTRRLEDAFDVLGRLEDQGLPFAVAVNAFEGTTRFPEDEVRTALDLPDEVPIVTCDARRRESAVRSLIALAQYALSTATHGSVR